MPDNPTVHEALLSVMEEVRSVKKGDFNQAQNFRFRGVDAVVNAVAPVMRKHRVLTTPQVLNRWSETYKTSKGSEMFRVTVEVRYEFTGPAGDTKEASVFGEASDSADKATSKAMSVAYRTALLQALMLPTDEVDPDAFTPPPVSEQAGATERSRLVQAKAKVWQLAQTLGWDKEQLSEQYRASTSRSIGDATAAQLEAYAKRIGDES